MLAYKQVIFNTAHNPHNNGIIIDGPFVKIPLDVDVIPILVLLVSYQPNCKNSIILSTS